jgi:hypothetical protein
MFNGQGIKAQGDQGVKVLRDLKLESPPIMSPSNPLVITAGGPPANPDSTNRRKKFVKKLNKMHISSKINT